MICRHFADIERDVGNFLCQKVLFYFFSLRASKSTVSFLIRLVT